MKLFDLKKLLMMLIMSILITSSLEVYAVSTTDTKNNLVSLHKDIELGYTISLPDIEKYNFITNENLQTIEIKNFGYLMTPGKPMLPAKSYLFALPPGLKATFIEYETINKIQIQGTYNIKPVDPFILLDNSDSEKYRSNKEWNKNYESTYSKNQYYPEKQVIITGSGTFRKYSYIQILICPFSYNPVTRKLYYSDSFHITINHKKTSYENTILNDNIADQKASKIFFNFNQIKNLYAPKINQLKTISQSYDYVIITNNELKNIVASSNFYQWKTNIGYNIKFVSITDSEITNQPGIDLAEKIRNFLRQYYILWEIKYVLIVGDYTTIPMRYCSPNPYLLEGTVPTDTYYADLSYPDNESWNSNNDDYYGVYGQDNPDFAPEIYVGRIPTSNIARLTYTLDKIVKFEQDTDSWKNNALHGGAMLFYANEDHNTDIDFDIDGARMIDYIEKDIMIGWTTHHYSEKLGLSPSVYEWDALNEQVFTSDWRSGEYAVVNWAAHGAPTSIGRVIWDWDDGDEIPEHENGELTWGSFLNTYSNLEDDYPSIVFAVSCNVGYPEPQPDGNLGIDMLTKESFGAAVAVLSATRGAAVSGNWVESHSGAEALCYEFNHYMINGPNGPSKLGEALYDSKFYVHSNFGWDHTYEFMNMYDYNVYGDPSMIREGISSSAPSSPKINGPSKGKNGIEYEYIFMSIDPTDDKIFYYIDWGDGNTEEWIGPYNAGEAIKVSHTWSEIGTHTIRAKAKDENGEESLWSTQIITMPLNKILTKPFIYQLYIRLFNK